MSAARSGPHFRLVALLATLLVVLLDLARGSIAVDPQHKGLSPEQQLQSASWEAEQGLIEKARVARQRYELKQAYKQQLVAGMESQKLRRQELICPPFSRQSVAPAAAEGVLGGHFWAILCLSVSAVLGWQLYRKTGKYNELLRLTEVYSGFEVQKFSVFADEFNKGPAHAPPRDNRPGVPRPVRHPELEPPGQRPVVEAEPDEISRQLTCLRPLVCQCNLDLPKERQIELIDQLLRHLKLLKTSAEKPELLNVWQLASALEKLLEELVRAPSGMTLSATRTLAGAVDLLHALAVQPTGRLLSDPPVRLLAVDDDAISRHAVSLALNKVLTRADLACNGAEAVALAKKYAYDAVFLDIEMPDHDGFEVCSLIHGTLLNRSTPVVFVTSHSGLAEQTKSTVVGGHDLIGKPFLIFELAVKALTLVLKRRLQ